MIHIFKKCSKISKAFFALGWHKKYRLRQVVFHGNLLHQVIVDPLFYWDDRCRVSFEQAFCEGIYLVEGEGHAVWF